MHRNMKLAAYALIATGAFYLSANDASAKGCNGVVDPLKWGCAAWDNNNGPQYPNYKPPAKAAKPAVAPAVSAAQPQRPPAVSNNSNAVVNRNGGKLITNDGGSLITNDGGSLVGNAGGTARHK